MVAPEQGRLKKGVLRRDLRCYSKQSGSNLMKKAFLILTLSLFGMTTVITAPPVGGVVLAQKKDKDEKRNPPGPPVIKNKGNQEVERNRNK